MPCPQRTAIARDLPRPSARGRTRPPRHMSTIRCDVGADLVRARSLALALTLEPDLAPEIARVRAIHRRFARALDVHERECSDCRGDA